MTKLNDSGKAMTADYRFAVALLKHKMNATAAAWEVFAVGKKGGKNPRASAQAMGSRALGLSFNKKSAPWLSGKRSRMVGQVG